MVRPKNRSILIAVGALLAAAGVFIATSSAGAAHDPFPTGETRTTLEQIAGELAAESGEVPSSADVVLTSRQRSQDALGGDVVDSDQPVYLVQMQGTFVLYAVPIPYGEEAPTGSALWFVFDPKTGERRALDR